MYRERRTYMPGYVILLMLLVLGAIVAVIYMRKRKGSIPEIAIESDSGSNASKHKRDEVPSGKISVQVPTEDDITPVNGPSRYSFMLSELSEIYLQDWPPPQAEEMFGWEQAIAKIQRHWSILASKKIWSPYPISAYCVGDASAPVPSSSLSSEEQAVLELLRDSQDTEDSEEKVRVRYFLFPLRTSKEQPQAVAQVIFETEIGAEVGNVRAWVDALREEELGTDNLRDISTALAHINGT